METFKTILCKTLYPKNTKEELESVFIPKQKPFAELFTSQNNTNKGVVIYQNPIYKGFLFHISNLLLFYNDLSSNNTENNIYDIVGVKYAFFKKHVTMITTKINEDFIDLFRDVQKHYRAFALFANIWKYKKSKIQIEHDLYLTQLNRNNRNVFSLLQQGKIYLFTASNLVNSITTSLSNAPNFFAEPLVLKNPYNNVPFSKSDLYNIYFFLKQSTILMPTLFHNYFLVDFDLRRFIDENENIIKCIAFKSYIKNGTTEMLYNDIITMLNKYQKNICIDKSFPKETIIDIMRPYLFLYYTVNYSAEEYRIIDAETHLRYKLKRLYSYNPCFGRKLVRLKQVMFSTKMTKYVEFSDKHPDFDEPMDIKTYQKTHLEIINTKYSSIHEEESDTSDTSENTNDENTDNEYTVNGYQFVIISQQPSLTMFDNTMDITNNYEHNVIHESETENTEEDIHNEDSNDDSNDDSNEEVIIEGDIYSNSEDESDADDDF